MRPRTQLRNDLVVLLLILFPTGGCRDAQPPRVAVHGRVLLDGKPLAQGTIAFVPAGTNRGPKAGGSIQAGRYRIGRVRGPLPGRLRVEIRSNGAADGFANPRLPTTTAQVESPARELIPARYNSASVLAVTAKLDTDNQFDFELRSQ